MHSGRAAWDETLNSCSAFIMQIDHFHGMELITLMEWNRRQSHDCSELF